MAIEVGTRPATAFIWARAFEDMGLKEEARLLRVYLLSAWLADLQGDAREKPLTVAQALTRAQSLREDQVLQAMQQNWTGILGQRLRLSLAPETVPLPDEIDALRSDLTEESPGFWSHRFRDGRLRGLFLLVGLQGDPPTDASLPLAAGPFGLRVGTGLLNFDCQLPRSLGPPVIRADQSVAYLCRGRAVVGLPMQNHALAPLLAQAMAQHQWHIETEAFDAARSAPAWMSLFEQTHRDELDRFMQVNGTCTRQGNCAAATPAPRKADGDHAASAPDGSSRFGLSQARREVLGKALLVLQVLIGFAVFWFVADWVGEWFSGLLIFLALGAYAWPKAVEALHTKTPDLWGGFVLLPLAMMLFVAPLLGAILPIALRQALRRPLTRVPTLILLAALGLLIVYGLGRMWLRG